MRSDARWIAGCALTALSCAIALLGAGCACTGGVSRSDAAAAPAVGGHELLNAVLWAQTAPEWQFACRQSFVLARERLDQALADTAWTAALEQKPGHGSLPPAVIVDIDETMLDNSPCEARLVREGKGFDIKMWTAWVTEARAAEIPGAVDFTRHAWDRGVRIFFVTNRHVLGEAATLANLRAVFGETIGPDDVLCKNEQEGWGSDKTSRRADLAASYRILLLIGDDFGDFTYLGEVGAAERAAAGQQYAPYWGTRWIILPNAMYGSWEEALYGHERLPDSTRLRIKYEALDTEP